MVSYNHDPKRNEPRIPSKVVLTAECKSSRSLGYVTVGVANLIRFHPGDTSNILFNDGHVMVTGVVTGTDFNDAGFRWWD